jgi:hypothetical protein
MDKECVVRFAGSGHSDYIDMTIEKMMAALRGQGKDIQGIKDIFEKVALNIHRRHIKPFYDMQDDYRPQVCLLVMIRMASGELELLRISHTTVSVVEDYEVLGAGEHLARSLIDWLYDPMTPTRLMRVIAINIVQQTKRYVSGVGGTTHVASLVREPQTRESSGLYDDSEFFFGIQKYLRPLLLAAIDETTNDDLFSGCRDGLIGLLNDVRAATKQRHNLEDRFFTRSPSEKSELEP